MERERDGENQWGGEKLETHKKTFLKNPITIKTDGERVHTLCVKVLSACLATWLENSVIGPSVIIWLSRESAAHRICVFFLSEFSNVFFFPGGNEK